MDAHTLSTSFILLLFSLTSLVRYLPVHYFHLSCSSFSIRPVLTANKVQYRLRARRQRRCRRRRRRRRPRRPLRPRRPRRRARRTCRSRRRAWRAHRACHAWRTRRAGRGVHASLSLFEHCGQHQFRLPRSPIGDPP
ncbi:hypothetical protein BU14_0023s0020 [Porphyra umbilicalis]|uniref:Uncharacterized protein n=1 Tax=Porphyra umbilicalis TaxID=2786 RepID=A0A1X6PK90_PORUM|nr:hypothetical protein BU14_0023s0020 [Porphyra umbilicalis]|eukprot:OSX81215.1 hypothetical protein BU14_0023s0020 [Porphyra umbilicalis]